MIAEAITAVAESFKLVFSWATGGRTQDENAMRAEVEKWRSEYDKAMAGKDFVHANFAWAQLCRLRDEAAAKSGK